ncbi:uncharacterized protein KGF55_005399 [Candida pseudojiufengensis]|uniref:uncharacterized protein n=1 Tax=Candida pseudojiufengensis TaxID=497109 RepID=UPI0022258B2E|nr:uncharacterized protein KGF55_005399 [Candida pseudojiufengensis]KAI5959422.1 hypothetical protein KGF55_005399 [Candida pseudojiufengensis]
MLITLIIFALVFNLTISYLPTKDYIIEFNDSSITQTLEKSEFSLVYFYSDTCKFCQHFEPVFENLCVLYNGIDSEKSKFQILAVNALQNKRLSQLFQIQHYPSIKLLEYSSKKIIPFEYDRDLQILINFIEHHVSVQPKYDNFVSKIHDFEDLKTLGKSKSNKIIIFAMSFLDEWQDIHFPAHFLQNLAIKYPEVEFTVVLGDKINDSSVLQIFGVSNFPSAIYLRNGSFKSLNTKSQDTLKYGELDEAQLIKFIENIENNDSNWNNQRNVEDMTDIDHTISIQRVDDYDDDDILDHIEL